MNTEEVWRPVPDYEGLYEVSSLGRLRSCSTGRLFGLRRSGKYVKVSLHKDRRQKTKDLHPLICAAFHGPRPSSGLDAAHLDGNVDNNRADNLAWVTRKANIGHCVEQGTIQRGERHYSAKLTAGDVEQMRVNRAAGMTYAEMARRYGISDHTAHEAVTRKTWKHVA